MNKDNQEKFARLLALSKVREAQVKANPLPFLNEISEKCFEMQRAIEHAMYELSGASSFDHAVDMFPDALPSIIETAVIRNQKAHDILADVLKRI